MEIQQLALTIFEKKHEYSNQDYLVIMNCLMEAYHNQQGTPQYYEVGDKDLDKELDSEDDQDDIAYTNYDSEEDEEHSGYLGSYIESY